MTNIIRALLAAGCVASVIGPGPALGAEYPSRPIRFIVPFPPGGPTDVIARIVGQKLTESLKQQVVVDNRSGAGGNIGMGIAASATPDGHTAIFVSSSFMVNPGLYKKIPYDPYKSFAPVTNVAASTHVFVTHPSQPVKSMAELIAQVRKNPRNYSMATPGIGTLPHLSAHLLALDAKIDILTVPYAGGGPSIAAVLGNQVPFACQAIPPVTVHILAGKVRALAITADKRSGIVPDVPTMAELGFKGHEAYTITGMLVPAGTPPAIIRKLNSEVTRIMALPDVTKRVTDLGSDIVANSPQEFSAYIRSEIEKWGKVIKAANITVN
jgi:tripartite-type tricarboxylate transporter receptor subunit TctC